MLIFPGDLGPLASGRHHDAELDYFGGTYGLDPNDAAILMEVQQIGVNDIVSLDVDMQQAQRNFTIYTWRKCRALVFM